MIYITRRPSAAPDDVHKLLLGRQRVRCAGLAHGVGHPCTTSSWLIWWSRAPALLHVVLRLQDCHGDHLSNHGRSKTSTGEHGTGTGKQRCARGRGRETPQCRQGQLGRADDGEGFVGCVVQWTFARMAASYRGSHVKNVSIILYHKNSKKSPFL